jgi:hypothetical protein
LPARVRKITENPAVLFIGLPADNKGYALWQSIELNMRAP